MRGEKPEGKFRGFGMSPGISGVGKRGALGEWSPSKRQRTQALAAGVLETLGDATMGRGASSPRRDPDAWDSRDPSSLIWGLEPFGEQVSTRSQMARYVPLISRRIAYNSPRNPQKWNSHPQKSILKDKAHRLKMKEPVPRCQYPEE